MFGQAKSVFLNLNHGIENASVVMENQSYSAPNGVPYKLKRLQYYISNIVITHDGGKVTPATKVYLLVDPKTFVYPLGDFEINTVENISFNIGIDSLTNHGDPSLFPAGHPLAPQNPSMHWGWASGYRFAAIEGNSDSGNGLFADLFEFHTIGDDLLTSVSVKTGSEMKDGNLMVTLNTNYNKIFDNINLYGGIIQHGNLSPNDKLMANFKKVFTGTNITSTSNVGQADMSVRYRNPSDNILLDYTSTTTNLEFSLYDLFGNKLMFQDNLNGSGTITNAELPSGIYIFNFSKNNKILEKGKIIITR